MLELDRSPLPMDSSIRDFQQGKVGYVANALEQPLLLPQDMVNLRTLKKHEVFLTLKRDLAMVRISTCYSLCFLLKNSSNWESNSLFVLFCFVFCFFLFFVFFSFFSFCFVLFCFVFFVFFLFFFFLWQAIKTAHIVEEWVDHAHFKLKDKEACRVLAIKNLALAKKKIKNLVTKLTEADRERKSAEVALVGAEKQVEKAKEQLAIAWEKINSQ